MAPQPWFLRGVEGKSMTANERSAKPSHKATIPLYCWTPSSKRSA
ncbi:hypothetical protein TGAM01_v209719 [Trichoderma gamsii]|uniref:Uncharacterized protein n=1 Tax=Trichoderma gamsii TaxID=398673 RepID=A0A2P4ZAS6_9HYPO|nr:hypothetical protein TGAM01_v209719 [Trichoderma gamsii]PON21418.1 hypothetical protein TGAM01_v209719 [Trichoderma gamsii]